MWTACINHLLNDDNPVFVDQLHVILYIREIPELDIDLLPSILLKP